MKRNKILAGVSAFVVLAAVAAGGVWYFVYRSDSPPSVSIESALSAVGVSQDNSDPSSNTSAARNLAGQWTIEAGGTSFVGYRVAENLAGVGAATAVGRTQGLTGGLDFDGDKVSKVQITADLTTLKSDKAMRDRALTTQSLQTNTYKTATFALSSPINVDSIPADGTTVTQAVKGDLTLHGVTKQIQMDVQAVLQGERLIVVGSTDIKFADYSISQPRSAAVLSVDDHGTMEFQLVFTKSA